MLCASIYIYLNNFHILCLLLRVSVPLIRKDEILFNVGLYSKTINISVHCPALLIDRYSYILSKIQI